MTDHIAILGAKGLPAKGGGERVAEAIIKKAIKDGFRITLYGKKDYCRPVNYGPNFKMITITEIKGKHLSAFSFGLLSALHALMFGKYDLIHLHYADFGYIVPLLKLKFKVIATSHGAEYNRDKWGKLAKLFFRFVEGPFVKYSNICTSMSKRLSDYYSQKYKKKVYFIPNGADILQDVKFGCSANIKYNLPINDYMLFAAGRVISSKGCDLLLLANKNLNSEIPLVIIGGLEGDVGYKFYLESLSKPNIKFVNFIEKKEDLFEIISNSKFFIFPSTYEAMSMMLLEVAFLKKGVVCSDIQENYDAIGNNAIFFKFGNYEDLANKIDFALRNQSVMDELGQKAYQYVKEKRNWEAITDYYIQLYKSLIKGYSIPINVVD